MPTALMRRCLPAAAFFLLALGISATPLLAQPAPPFNPDEIPVPAALPSALQVASLFAENCAPCHGPTGNSDGPTAAELPEPPPAFADPATAWDQSPAAYFHITKFGRIENLMPPWRNQLTDEQIWQAVYYARSLHTDAATVEDGAALYAASCASCHGPEGGGEGPEATTTPPDFGDQAAMIQLSDAELAARWNSAHAELGAEWDERQQQAVLDYIRTFSYSPPWVSLYAAGSGVIAGSLVQGTPGAAAPAAVPLTLYGFLDFTQVMSATTTSTEEGTFRFEKLDVNPEIAYIVEADYAGVGYTSEFLRLSPDASTNELTLNVYELGDDDSNIAIRRANWIVDHQPGELLVGEILVYSNRGDATFSGKEVAGAERPVTLAVSVPPDAFGLEFPDGVLGGRYIQIDDVVYDTAPIPPGEEVRQFFVSYRLPYDGESATIEQRWLYPVERLNLLVAALPDLSIESDELTYLANDTLEGVEFEVWNAEALAAGSRTAATLDGLLAADSFDPRLLAEGESATGAAAPTATAPPLEPWVPLALGGLAALVLGAFMAVRVGRATETAALLAQERDELVHQIAALDDRHARGELDDGAWLQQRAQLKQQLMETAQQLRLQEASSG